MILEHALIESIAPGRTLTDDEIASIIRLAALTADVDFRPDADEDDALARMARTLWASVGRAPQRVEPVSPIPLDAEERNARIAELARHLRSREARELAYVAAYILAVVDLDLAPTQAQFLAQLQRALGIDDERAADLVSRAAEAVTPGVEELERPTA
jgi:hypothetical protein